MGNKIEINKIIPELFLMQNVRLKAELIEMASVETFKNGEILIEAGERPKYFFLLLEGLVRFSYFGINGVEYTQNIVYNRGYPITDLLGKEKSHFRMSAIGEVTLLKFPAKKISELFSYPDFLGSTIEIMSKALVKHSELAMVMRGSTPAKRYKWFLQVYGEYVSRIPKNYIASFLNMTPETLSRVLAARKETDVVVDNLPFLVGDDPEETLMARKEYFEDMSILK